MKSLYEGQSVAFATKHQKVSLVAKDFENIAGINIEVAQVDTDLLGTFAGEIERELPHKETALLKAEIGAKHLNFVLGIASEGRIGSDPVVPFLNSNIETMVFIDLERDLQIIENHRSFDISAVQIEANNQSDLSDFLVKADFPNHKLIVKDPEMRLKPIKGIDNYNALKEAITSIINEGNLDSVIVESDFRAHCSPTRQANIKIVGEKLAKRVAAICKSCNSPGWGELTFEKGLNCSRCGLVKPDALYREVLNCIKCDYSELGRVIAELLDPGSCNFCNP